MFTIAVKDAALRAVLAGPLRINLTNKDGQDLGLPAQPVSFGQPEGDGPRAMSNTELILFPAWETTPPAELGWRLIDAQGNERVSGRFDSSRVYEPGDALFIPAGMVRVGVA